jgi:hypothetical protein
MNPSICYLASPYSHADPAVRQARFAAACRAGAKLIMRGLIVFSPIAHSHAICQHGVPLDWHFWQAHDLAFLAMCDEVVVLKLDGWELSTGVQAEIAAAKALGKPVSFLDPAAVAEERSGAT